MADLGAVGNALGFYDDILTGGYLAFQVKDSGGTGVQRELRVYQRSDGALLRSGLTDRGGYCFVKVPPLVAVPLFDAVALDNDAGTDLADVYFSRLTPQT